MDFLSFIMCFSFDVDADDDNGNNDDHCNDCVVVKLIITIFCRFSQRHTQLYCTNVHL